MKITFQGEGFHDILDQMKAMLAAKNILPGVSEKAKSSAVPSTTDEFKFVGSQGPGPDLFDEPKAPVDKPVVKPADKPAKTVNPQIAKMQAAKAAKKAEREAAAKAAPPVEKPEPKAEPVDPADMVKIRQKTIADLQDAYANGHQAEVFELLSRFGNGAKSFRELPPDAFVPISEAIAKGALT